MNVQLLQEAMRYAHVKPDFVAYDLYSGAGNFALPLARSGARVTAVECDPRLVLFGRQNATRFQLQNRLQFLEESVERFLEHLPKNTHCDLIIADPPRSGLGKIIPQLNFANRFLYIACHLPSFVRDIRAVVDQGWKVEAIVPFDMFAQTSYVEILGVLTRE